MRAWQFVLCAAAMAVARGADAQSGTGDGRPPIDLRVPDTTSSAYRLQQRFAGQVDGVQMRPTGELAQNIGFGYGIGGVGLFALDVARIVALRGEFTLMQYGSETKHSALSPTIGGRIQVNVNTSNDVFVGGLGAQVMAPSGWIRPYVAGSAAVVSFVTESSVNSPDTQWEFASTTNHQDTQFAWLASGGVLVPLHYGSTVISLHAGVTYTATQGRVSYLRPGSITDLPNGDIAIDPLYSEARFVTWRIGVGIGH